MPRNPSAPSGADELGLTAVDDMDGVTEVKQGASRFDGVVLDFTASAAILVPDNTEVELTIKGAKVGATNAGDPKISIRYEVSSGEYESLVFFDDLLFIPARPPKKGTMWRVAQLCAAIKHTLPTALSGSDVMPWLKQFCEDLLGEQFKAVLGINQSTAINPKTGKVYDPRQVIKTFIAQGDRSLDDLLNS